jgi:hypothetical protein
MGYFPNGTEGMMFEEAWCANCVHSDISGDREIGVDPPCPVWLAHSLYAYELCNEKEHPGKVILDLLIEQKEITASDGFKVFPNECRMFHPVTDGVIPGSLRFVEREKEGKA